MKNIFFLFCLLIVSYQAKSQAFNTQSLYLKIDTTNPRETMTEWLQFTPQEKVYLYTFLPNLPDLYLQLWCLDRNQVQTVSTSQITSYPIKTLAELEAYFNTLTREQILNYIGSVQNYYVVEFLGNGQVEIVPTKLDVNLKY